jgi:hypothetical protein
LVKATVVLSTSDCIKIRWIFQAFPMVALHRPWL